MIQLSKKYTTEIAPALKKQFQYKNSMQIPRLAKIVVNVGIGKMTKDGRTVDHIVEALKTITGQKPMVRKAKKSIAGFKLREGTDVGYMITLRGRRMYDFMDRLISIALPRSRDFQGLSNSSFDGRGTYSMGIKEHTIFPEVSYESLRDIFGFQISLVTTAKTKEEAYALLKSFGMPIQEIEQNKS